MAATLLFLYVCYCSYPFLIWLYLQNSKEILPYNEASRTNDHIDKRLTKFDAILESGVECPFYRILSTAYRCKPNN